MVYAYYTNVVFCVFFKNARKLHKNNLSDTKQRRHMLKTSYFFGF